MNPMKALQGQGQSVWLDYIRRNLITSGELAHLVREDGLRGVTSNPTIFEKAIAGSTDYDEQLRSLISRGSCADTAALYETLAIEDIRMAADTLRPVYDETDGTDGFVCLEVSPHLAHDTAGTINEAKRLWHLLDRSNLMVKVPATSEGIPAIETLIAEGINVNVTLIFSLAHYEAVAQAYLRGLERRQDPSRVASVASFFVSRVDTAVDRALDAIGTLEALELRGEAAIANVRMAYRRFRRIFSGEQWERLAQRGARVQRPLWASTGAKNPAYPELLYVEEIIGPDTVNTLPPATLNAFLEHGLVRGATVQEGLVEAEAILARLKALGIDLNAVTERLQTEGVAAFAASFDQLMATLEHKRDAILVGQVGCQHLNLGGYQARVEERLQRWQSINFSRRLWCKDPTLWSLEPVPELGNRLGWLSLPEMVHEQLDDFTAFADEVRNEQVRHVVLLGMGGSSLAPEVFHRIFGSAPGFPELIVLDSTHPATVRTAESRIDLRHALFLVSSKSGTTIETLALFRHFWHRVEQGTPRPGRSFVAITDPGTPLAYLARERGFRRLFEAPPDVGGRYSALTAFGLVPAALTGVDVHRLLDRAWRMAEASAFCVPERENPGLVLGAALGELALAGLDKATFLASPSLEAFPAWLEQLIAESTGKNGKGIIPVVDEPPASPSAYGQDRFFVSICLDGDDSSSLDQRLKMLEAAGYPVIRIQLREKIDIGQEFFRWEVAVAAAGAAIGIHPFNQPDVEAAKELARKAMQQAGSKGQDHGLQGADLVAAAKHAEIGQALKKWLAQVKPGEYMTIQAYLHSTHGTTDRLQQIRWTLLDRFGVATTLGYGPQFLHSTGQLHKGGPNTGLFLQLVYDVVDDLPVPETDYSVAALIQAQALGDSQALRERGRRVLRVHLGSEVARGLKQLVVAISES